MKNLLATLGLLAIATPTATSLATLSNATNAEQIIISQSTIAEEIVAGIKANLWKLHDADWLVTSRIMTVDECYVVYQGLLQFIPYAVLPWEIAQYYNPLLMQLNDIKIDGQQVTDEILATEGVKFVEFNFNYGEVTNENIGFNVTFKFA